MAAISFFSDGVEFVLSNEEEVRDWLFNLAKTEEKKLTEVDVVFVSDDNLLEMNKKFLQHDFFTDILTFPNDGPGISGELFISIDRVRENAITEKTDFIEELHRVIAHGFLHLFGYDDKSETEKLEMRARELFYLNLRPF